jgi:hypothetical protein
MGILTRVVVMVTGFLVASAIAALLMTIVTMLQGPVAAGAAGYPMWDPRVLLGAILVMVQPAFIITVTLTLLPTLLVVIFAERRRLRSIRYYVLTGAVVGIASRLASMVGVAFIMARGTRGPLSLGLFSATAITSLAVAAAVGAVGGIIYWGIAGRTAGQWSSRLARDAATTTIGPSA